MNECNKYITRTERKGATGADGDDAVLGLQDVAQARDLKGDARVRNQQGRLCGCASAGVSIIMIINKGCLDHICRNHATTLYFYPQHTSSRRRYLSVRQALARSTHARVSCPGCSSSFRSSRSIRVKQSAVDPFYWAVLGMGWLVGGEEYKQCGHVEGARYPPAKPAMMSSPMRRTCMMCVRQCVNERFHLGALLINNISPPPPKPKPIHNPNNKSPKDAPSSR